MMLLEKSKRSQTVMPDGEVAPRPDQPAEQPAPAGQPKPAGRGGLLKFAIGIVVLVAAVFFGVQAGSRLFDKWADLTPVTAEESATATPDTNTTATDTATPAATTEETPAAAATTTSTPATTPTTPAATPITVKVLNGNGVAGDANKVKALLEAAGISVSATGNAKTFGYATTIVYYVAGKKDAADKTAAALTGYQVTTTENAVAEGYDALVVVGAK